MIGKRCSVTAIGPVLPCGGSGTRLWPLSRKSHPKRCAPRADKQTLFWAAPGRLSGPGYAAPVILTGGGFRFLVTGQAQIRRDRARHHQPRTIGPQQRPGHSGDGTFSVERGGFRASAAVLVAGVRSVRLAASRARSIGIPGRERIGVSFMVGLGIARSGRVRY